MALEINSTSTRIGVERTDARFDMDSQFSKIELESKKINLNMRTELPKVQIDQYECFASVGLKGNADISRDAFSSGYQQVMAYISKVSADGDALGAIENRGSTPIIDIATRDATSPQHEFDIESLPKASPRITVTGSVSMDPDPTTDINMRNSITARYIPGYANVNFTPSKVSFRVEQKGSISVQYTPDKKVDVRV